MAVVFAILLWTPARGWLGIPPARRELLDLADEMDTFAHRLHGYMHTFNVSKPEETMEEMSAWAQARFAMTDEEREDDQKQREREYREREHTFLSGYMANHRADAIRLFQRAQERRVAEPDPSVQPLTASTIVEVIYHPTMPQEVGMLSTVYREYAKRLRALA
jgi:hypothetical protein